MLELSKSLKMKISASILWVIISALIVGWLVDNSYHGFSLLSFLSFFILSNMPLVLYWLGFWIWGEGFARNSYSEGKKLVTHNFRTGLLAKDIWSETSIKPWRRFFARILDIVIFIAVFTVIIFSASQIQQYIAGLSMVAINMVFFIFAGVLSAIVIGLTGSSIGKCLFGIKIRNKYHRKLSIKEAFEREARIFVSGEAFGIPLIGTITMLFAYFKLRETGVTSWDSKGGYTVAYRNNNIKQILLSCAGIMLLFTVVAFANLLVDIKLNKSLSASSVSIKSSSITNNTFDDFLKSGEHVESSKAAVVNEDVDAKIQSQCAQITQELAFGYLVAKFAGRLDDIPAQDCFAIFISVNDGQIVYIDAYIPMGEVYEEDSFSFSYECEYGSGCGGNEYLVHDYEGFDSIYEYNGWTREHHIKGYWAVKANTAVNQGFSSNILSGIATEKVNIIQTIRQPN